MNAVSDHPAHPLAYLIALLLHIATATIGFGRLAMSGVYGATGRKLRTAEDLGDLRRFFGRPNRAGRAPWAVPVTGALALWLHHGAAALGQTWAVAATGCCAATVLAVTVIWPVEHRIGAIVTLLGDDIVDQAPDLTELGRSCRPVVRAAAACDVTFAVAVLLMILQPGR